MKCLHCGGFMVADDHLGEIVGVKCEMCGRRPHENNHKGEKTMEEKKCNTCGQTLPGEKFSKNRSTLDGLERSCKECMKKKMKRVREKRRAALRAGGPSGPEAREDVSAGAKLPRRRMPSNPAQPAAQSAPSPGAEDIGSAVVSLRRAFAQEMIALLKKEYGL